MTLKWDMLRVVLAVDRTGSLTRAATLLGVDASTAARTPPRGTEPSATKLAALRSSRPSCAIGRAQFGMPRPAQHSAASQAPTSPVKSSQVPCARL